MENLQEQFLNHYGWELLSKMVTTHDAMWVSSGTECGEPVGMFIPLDGGAPVFGSPDKGELIDITHLSNEGHLRAMACRISEESLMLLSNGGIYTVTYLSPCPKTGALLPKIWGKGNFVGEAYVQGIMNSQEGSRFHIQTEESTNGS